MSHLSNQPSLKLLLCSASSWTELCTKLDFQAGFFLVPKITRPLLLRTVESPDALECAATACRSEASCLELLWLGLLGHVQGDRKFCMLPFGSVKVDATTLYGLQWRCLYILE